MEFSSDLSITAGLQEAMAAKNAASADKVQAEVLDKALDIGTEAVAKILEMMEPGSHLDVLV